MERNPIKLFYCYSREDEALRNKLAQHLEPLRREGLIITWYDREISAGKEFLQEIHLHLDTSDILLALISPAFISSTYCYDIEIRRALDRHIFGEMRIIPIILRPVEWHHTLLGKLQALPRDGKPVVKWKPVDDGWRDTARSVRKVVEELLTNRLVPNPERSWFYSYEGHLLLSHQFYEDALEAFKQAIRFDSENIYAWDCMASILLRFERYEEALLASERVIQNTPLNSLHPDIYRIKSDALEKLGRLKEADIARNEGKNIKQQNQI